MAYYFSYRKLSLEIFLSNNPDKHKIWYFLQLAHIHTAFLQVLVRATVCKNFRVIQTTLLLALRRVVKFRLYRQSMEENCEHNATGDRAVQQSNNKMLPNREVRYICITRKRTNENSPFHGSQVTISAQLKLVEIVLGSSIVRSANTSSYYNPESLNLRWRSFLTQMLGDSENFVRRLALIFPKTTAFLLFDTVT